MQFFSVHAPGLSPGAGSGGLAFSAHRSSNSYNIRQTIERRFPVLFASSELLRLYDDDTLLGDTLVT